MLGKNKKKYQGKKNTRDHVEIIGQKPRTVSDVFNVVCVAEVNGRGDKATTGTWEPAATGYALSAPVGTPWAFSLLTFAREIDHLSQELLFKCVPHQGFIASCDPY